MVDSAILPVFHRQFDDLISVISESNRRIIDDPVDPLFRDYVNVFIKSYVVSACSILEAFIQDLIFSYMQSIEKRISESNIPRNIVLWSVVSDPKSTDLKFERFGTGLTKRHVSDIVSGNFYKTIKVFEMIGIDIKQDAEFKVYKDFIGSTVEKRNKIVHHNDSASDLSLPDVVAMVNAFKNYIDCLHGIVLRNPHFH